MATIKIYILNKSDFSVTGKILYVDFSIDNVNNTFIVTSEFVYIVVTKRFDVLLFNPCDK